ncbi:hypothetical protein [Streptomyces camelliae]|uniref:Uncharacterized protein n=1 Tax=Streptomyces camelliae TaxID=3004093 RepID=A0ABY7PFZ1_9ACTN|nr:hypothetical protein [Streptomyces sp. HUAS 2-6]WBO68449.1 hypothetical protein O1G22_39345 [Streptomyces sp. HUAS 2-6]
MSTESDVRSFLVSRRAKISPRQAGAALPDSALRVLESMTTPHRLQLRTPYPRPRRLQLLATWTAAHDEHRPVDRTGHGGLRQERVRVSGCTGAGLPEWVRH